MNKSQLELTQLIGNLNQQIDALRKSELPPEFLSSLYNEIKVYPLNHEDLGFTRSELVKKIYHHPQASSWLKLKIRSFEARFADIFWMEHLSQPDKIIQIKRFLFNKIHDKMLNQEKYTSPKIDLNFKEYVDELIKQSLDYKYIFDSHDPVSKKFYNKFYKLLRKEIITDYDYYLSYSYGKSSIQVNPYPQTKIIFYLIELDYFLDRLY